MIHRPPHLILNNTLYFITAHTYKQSSIFQTQSHKAIWLETLTDLTPNYGIDLFAWVLLHNHYHVLMYFENANRLPNFIQRFLGSTAYQLNKLDKAKGRTIWYNYWDRCVRDEKDLWTKLNYIHYNPVKHGYVDCIERWDFSSYSSFITKYGEECMDDAMRSFPVIESNFEGGEGNKIRE